MEPISFKVRCDAVEWMSGGGYFTTLVAIGVDYRRFQIELKDPLVPGNHYEFTIK